MSTTKSLDAQLESISAKLRADITKVMQTTVASEVILEENNVIKTFVYERPFERKVYEPRKENDGLIDIDNYATEVKDYGNEIELSVANMTQANDDLYFVKDNGERYMYKRKSVNEGKLLLPIIEEGNDAYGDFPGADGIWRDPVPIREITLHNLSEQGLVKKSLTKGLKGKGWKVE